MDITTVNKCPKCKVFYILTLMGWVCPKCFKKPKEENNQEVKK